MIIANYTPDTIKWMHVGVEGTLKPGDVFEFEDSRARHILNKYGDRGLIALSYGDEGKEEDKKASAMTRYKQFWIKQISYFNVHNEALKNNNKAYVSPTSELEKHATEFGIDLIAPWSSARADKDKELDRLQNENEEFRRKLESISTQMTSLTAGKAITQGYEDYRNKFKTLNKNQLDTFVSSNAADILTWPVAIVLELKEKYVRFYGEDEWPLAL